MTIVEIRALRGTRRSSVYRECLLSGDLYRRVLTTGTSRGLPVLTALDAGGPNRLDKSRARRFAREVAALQDALFEPEVAAVVEVALWCAHASQDSWLIIQPQAPEDAGAPEPR